MFRSRPISIGIFALAIAVLAACSQGQAADCTEAIWLTVVPGRQVLINGDPTPVDKVTETLSARYAGRKECHIMVRAEGDVVYADVMPLMNALVAAGFGEVALVAEEVVQ